MNINQELDYLINYLASERGESIEIPEDLESKKLLFRSLCNVRLPKPISEDFLKIQDSYLEKINQEYVSSEDIEPISKDSKIALWQGDITNLKVEAIVNACNNKLLGCFHPLHNCIDNIIHSKAGIQLRLDCNELMKKQGHDEPNGMAKITKAYNLPSDYVIHTVGPQIMGEVRKQDELDLANCYISSLKLCEEYDIKTIAFPCISTGVFSYPEDEAANVAINTVKQYLNENKNTSLEKVIFNVFNSSSKEIYESRLY